MEDKPEPAEELNVDSSEAGSKMYVVDDNTEELDQEAETSPNDEEIIEAE